VAVKTLHEELSKEHYQRRLFEKEVAVCSRLHHPNIAAICGVIQEEGAPFSLIIELLQASLADVIEAAHVSGKYLTLREQTDVSHDCLSGLTYLHELPLPVLHGDIRPTNILMTSVMRAKLGDLGAARFTDGSLSVGPMSPLYVAPERLADRTLPNSKEADVYSMGISLGELFTGNQMDREDRPRQLRVVRQRNLRLVCVCMACDNVRNRMMASEVLAVNDRVFKTEDYDRCPPRRMVRGLADGVDKFTLCEKPW
jgi:serine/threonine protein kinase